MLLGNWDGLQQTADDVHRKFSETYIWAVAPGVDDTPRVYQISAIEGHDAFLRYTNPGANRHVVGVSRWRDVDVIYAYPLTLGAIPFGLSVLYIQRHPARQWHVGLYRGNTLLSNHLLQPAAFGFREAHALFNPTYEKLTVQDAVKELENTQKQAIALSNKYWLSKRDDKVSLYSGRLCLGSFSFGGFFIHKSCGDLRQELWDDLRLKV